MGLTCSYGAYDGGYSLFNHWRRRVAQIAGLPPLEFMEGWYGFGAYKNLSYAFTARCGGNEEDIPTLVAFSEASLPIKWECLKPDPLLYLLNHSDCDGEITAKRSSRIADRLEELLLLWPEDTDMSKRLKLITVQFIKGCREAAAEGKPLLFI